MDCMDILIKKLRCGADREEKINMGEVDEMVNYTVGYDNDKGKKEAITGMEQIIF